MPDITASDQNHIVTWKVISIGTAVVVAVFLILWFARTASGHAVQLQQQTLQEMAVESRMLSLK
jgi:hypothetical protein